MYKDTTYFKVASTMDELLSFPHFIFLAQYFATSSGIDTNHFEN